MAEKKTATLSLSPPTVDEDIEAEVDGDAAVATAKRDRLPPPRKGAKRTTTTKTTSRRETSPRRAPTVSRPAEQPTPVADAAVVEERRKTFSLVRGAIVQELKEFKSAWKGRYSGRKAPAVKWVVQTFLSQYFLVDDVQRRVAEAKLAELEESTNEEETLPRADYSVSLAETLLEAIDSAKRTWNSATPSQTVSEVWLFEMAFQQFVGEKSLIEAAATEVAKELKKSLETGPSTN